MTTKEQERKALEQIKKIIDGLGADSYISMAFDGCVEDAEMNIENDFGCSMKQRYEKARDDAEYFHKAANNYAAESIKREEQLDNANKCIDGLRKDLSDASAEVIKLSKLAEDALNDASRQNQLIHDKDMEIVTLKARLYDLLCKGA